MAEVKLPAPIPGPKKQVTDDLPIPRIQVRKFRGKAGGFDTGERTMYICELVGIDGTVCPADTSNTWGHRESTYPNRDAEQWHRFTGWPIVRVKTVATVAYTLKLDMENA